MSDRVGTGLMMAAWGGNIPMVELFVSRGADVNRVNRVQERAELIYRGGSAAPVPEAPAAAPTPPPPRAKKPAANKE